MKSGEPGKAKDGAQLKDGATKGADGGASAGPGAAKKDEAGASGGPGKAGGPGAAKGDDEEELVDPNADRPNFGATPTEDEEESGEADENEEGASAGAGPRARGGKAAAKKAKSKPLDPAYVTVAVMALAVISLAGLIWLGRGIMVQMWPGISGFYKSVGVEAAKPGDGLKIAESSKRLQRIGGVETLVVRGFISNISEVPKTVPNLKLELYNEKKEVIQDSNLKAPVGILDPQGSVEFEIRMELPQLSQAKGGYGVVWDQ